MTLSPARAAVFARMGHMPLPMAPPRIVKGTKRSKDVEAPPRLPEVTVPSMGVAQIILRHWFRVEKYLWEAVDGSMRFIVSVTYFRLWLPVTKQFWPYRMGAKNLVPHDAIIVYG